MTVEERYKEMQYVAGGTVSRGLWAASRRRERAEQWILSGELPDGRTACQPINFGPFLLFKPLSVWRFLQHQ